MAQLWWPEDSDRPCVGKQVLSAIAGQHPGQWDAVRQDIPKGLMKAMLSEWLPITKKAADSTLNTGNSIDTSLGIFCTWIAYVCAQTCDWELKVLTWSLECPAKYLESTFKLWGSLPLKEGTQGKTAICMTQQAHTLIKTTRWGNFQTSWLLFQVINEPVDAIDPLWQIHPMSTGNNSFIIPVHLLIQ